MVLSWGQYDPSRSLLAICWSISGSHNDWGYWAETQIPRHPTAQYHRGWFHPKCHWLPTEKPWERSSRSFSLSVSWSSYSRYPSRAKHVKRQSVPTLGHKTKRVIPESVMTNAMFIRGAVILELTPTKGQWGRKTSKPIKAMSYRLVLQRLKEAEGGRRIFFHDLPDCGEKCPI